MTFLPYLPPPLEYLHVIGQGVDLSASFVHSCLTSFVCHQQLVFGLVAFRSLVASLKMFWRLVQVVNGIIEGLREDHTHVLRYDNIMFYALC